MTHFLKHLWSIVFFGTPKIPTTPTCPPITNPLPQPTPTPIMHISTDSEGNRQDRNDMPSDGRYFDEVTRRWRRADGTDASIPPVQPVSACTAVSKPLYTDYFLTIAYLVAMRSIDPSTKCGAVLVSADKRILSTGYNGPLRGANDSKVPLTRPDKYPHMIHAEENCLLAYNGSFQDLEGSTMYVTGKPCHKCLRMILQKGIHNIVVTKGNQTVMHDDAEEKICQSLMDILPADSINYQTINNVRDIHKLLQITMDYIVKKNPNEFYKAS